MKKMVILIMFIFGISCLILHSIAGKYQVCVQVVGVCLTMFSAYQLSRTVVSKEKKDKDNFNL